MSRPNIDQKFEDIKVEEHLFECECRGDHFLQVIRDEDEKDKLWLNFIDYPSSLFQTIRWWWKQKKVWFSEAELSMNDCKALRSILDNHIKEYEQKSSEKKEGKEPVQTVSSERKVQDVQKEI